MRSVRNFQSLMSNPAGSNTDNDDYANPEDDEESLKPDILPNDEAPLSRQEKTENGIIGFQYSGPLRPSDLEQYDKLSPGFAKKYLNGLLEETQHRRKIENKEINIVEAQVQIESDFLAKGAERSRMGLRYGFFSVALVVFLSAYLASTGNSTAAAWLAGTILPSLAGVFVFGKLSQSSGIEDAQDSEKSLQDSSE